MNCLVVEDLPLLSSIQDRRARLVNYCLYRIAEYERTSSNWALLSMVLGAWYHIEFRSGPYRD